MIEYHKIQSVYKRDPKTHKFIVEITMPEFDYLAECEWIFTEKIDGTNVRVEKPNQEISNCIKFGGRTDNAQMPVKLMEHLQKIFTADTFNKLPEYYSKKLCLYGEGYGGCIQKNGKDYSPTESFILFDVMINDRFYLPREEVERIADALEIVVVPIIGRGDLWEAIHLTKDGFSSRIGSCQAEGLVVRPKIELLNCYGDRVITKMKTKDFEKEEE